MKLLSSVLWPIFLFPPACTSLLLATRYDNYLGLFLLKFKVLLPLVYLTLILRLIFAFLLLLSERKSLLSSCTLFRLFWWRSFMYVIKNIFKSLQYILSFLNRFWKIVMIRILKNKQMSYTTACFVNLRRVFWSNLFLRRRIWFCQ